MEGPLDCVFQWLASYDESWAWQTDSKLWQGLTHTTEYTFAWANLEILNGRGRFRGIILKFEGMFNREMEEVGGGLGFTNPWPILESLVHRFLFWSASVVKFVFWNVKWRYLISDERSRSKVKIKTRSFKEVRDCVYIYSARHFRLLVRPHFPCH